MATSTTPALTIDWSFAAKVIALRFLQVGALVAVIIACIVYIVKVLKFTRDVFVVYNVAFGGRDQRHKELRRRLHMYVLSVKLLDEVGVQELYGFCKKMMESNITIEQFWKVLLGYRYIFFFRDKLDGTLRGMFLMDVKDHTTQGRRYKVVKMGLALFHRHYRGGPLIFMAVLYHVGRHLLLHPLTPVYIIGKAFSYMSYLAAVSNFSTAYPRHDCPNIPEFEKSIMDEFGEGFATKEDRYDPTTCVIHRENSKLRPYIAPIKEHLLQNPHVKYFQQLNPEWQKGHCLVTMALVTWRNLIPFIWKTFRRLAKRKEVKGHSPFGGTHSFVSQQEFLESLKKKNLTLSKMQYLELMNEIDMVDGEEEVEEADGEEGGAGRRQKGHYYMRSPSIRMGVDRIDEYSDIAFN